VRQQQVVEVVREGGEAEAEVEVEVGLAVVVGA